MNPRLAERRQALRATWPNPILWVRHGAACLGFLANHAARRVSRRLARDGHAVGKSYPAWLPAPPTDEAAQPATSGSVTWPEYAPTAEGAWPVSAAPLPSTPADDVEAYFATHRWGNCLAALGGSDADIEAAVRQAVAWWHAPPPRSDPAWEPYSTAERIANLVVLLAARPNARRHVSDGHLRTFLGESQRWLSRHLEYYGSKRTNNHILNDARALVIAGAILDKEAVVYRGLQLFARMGPELLQTGGFLRERSAHYHVVVTNWLLDAVHFARWAARSMTSARAPLKVLEELAGCALRATTLLAPWATGNSLIGDISPDCAPEVSLARLRRLYGGLMSPVHGPTGGQQIDDWVFFYEKDHRLAACTTRKRFPTDLPTHGHSDLTHFVWRWRDVELLVDAGRTRYTKDAVSLTQSGAEGHNVVLVNGMGPLAESLVEGGLWHLRPYANAEVSTRVDGRSLVVTHDGFRRLGRVGAATRTVRLTDEGLFVEDRIDGRGTVTIDRLWHFAPHVRPVGASAVSGGGLVATAANGTPSGVPSDWLWETYLHSSAYGDATAAPLLRIRSVTQLPCTLTTTWTVAPCAA
jgi:hypothetical protein